MNNLPRKILHTVTTVSALLITSTFLFACDSQTDSESVKTSSTEISSEVAIEDVSTPDTSSSVSDYDIYIKYDLLLRSSDNPSNWSNEEIGIAGITDMNSDEYQAAVTSWQQNVQMSLVSVLKK